MLALDHLTPMAVAVLVLGAFFIGISKAGFGGGPGMLVPPLLALFLPPKLAVGLILPLLLATDVFALRFFWGKWDRKSVATILLGAAVGIAIGTWLLAGLSEDALKKAIGLLAVLLGGAQMLRDRLMPTSETKRPAPWLGVVAGVVCGVGSTLAHQGGLPVMLYLLPQKLDGVAFVGTTTAIFFFVNAAKVGPYLWRHMISPPVLAVDALLLPVLYLGTLAGVKLVAVVPKEWFLRVVLWFVLLTGLKLLGVDAWVLRALHGR